MGEKAVRIVLYVPPAVSQPLVAIQAAREARSGYRPPPSEVYREALALGLRALAAREAAAATDPGPPRGKKPRGRRAR